MLLGTNAALDQNGPWNDFHPDGTPKLAAPAAPAPKSSATMSYIPKITDPNDEVDSATKGVRLQIDRVQLEKSKHDLAKAIADDAPDAAGMDPHAVVQALVDGRMQLPGGAGMRSPYWQGMIQKVTQADPSFDAVNYGARAAARKDFTSGKSAQNIRSLDTAIGHLAHLNDQIGGTASHNFTPFNAVENAGSAILGSSGPTKFEQTAGALASELTLLFRNGGGSEADINREIEHLSVNGSLEQKQAAVRNIAGLMKSRLDALGDQYKQGMGTTALPFQTLSPEAKRAYDAIQGLMGDAAPPDAPGGHTGEKLVPGDMVPHTGFRFTPEQETAFRTMALHGGSPDQLVALAGAYGQAITPDSARAFQQFYADPKNRNVHDPLVNYSATDAAEHDAAAAMAKRDGGGGLGDLITHGATWNLSDEASGVGNALYGALTGDLNLGQNYRIGRDAAEMKVDDARKRLGIAGNAAEIAGGLIGFNPEAVVTGIAQPALSERLFSGAKTGAAAGAAAGFGSGRGVGGSLEGAATGAASGALLGTSGEALAAGIGSKIAARAAKAQEALPVIDAAERQGVRLAVPHVDPTARARFSAVDAAPVSGGIAKQALADTNSAIERRVGEIAGGPGVDRQTLGDTLRASGLAADQKAKAKVTSAYGIAERSAAGQQVTPTSAVATLDGHIQDLSRTPNSSGPMLTKLRSLRDDLVEPAAPAQAADAAAPQPTAEAGSPIQPVRTAANVSEARRLVRAEIVGKPITNDATGVQATVSNATLGKMTSASAMGKSASAADHLLAVTNADHLFRSAQLIERHPDPRGEPTLTMSKWRALMDGPEGQRGVKITVKETSHPDSPNPLYSIESVEPDLLAPPAGGIERGPGQNRFPRQAGSADDVGAPAAPVEGAAKPMAVDALNGLKSRVGSQLGDNLRSTDMERRLGEVYGAAKDDIGAQLTGSAARNFKRAQAMHKARMDRLGVLESFIGQDGSLDAEKVVQRIQAAAGDRNGASDRLGKFLDVSTPEARQTLAATLAERMGKASADDQGFSSARFLSEFDKMSPRARQTIWGETGARDLADLATIARQHVGVQKQLNNSGSGRVLNWQNALGGLLGGGGALTAAAGGGAAAGGAAALTGAAVAGAKIGANVLTAKALTNPKAVRAIALAARADTLAKQNTAVRRLGALAKDPALTDLSPVKDALEKAWGEDYRSRKDQTGRQTM